jgi:hypothetical protein
LPDEIRKALKAVDLMKIFDGQVALGSKTGTKSLGEHKVRLLSLSRFLGRIGQRLCKA